MKRTVRWLTFSALAILASLSGLNGLAQETRLKAPGIPQAASPDEVARIMAKPPAGLEIVDIRTPAEYADYALPGSLNLDPATVLADESLRAGSGPLLLVDKDGTEAFAVAGALAQKASRPVMVLAGGLKAWWNARELGLIAKAAPPAVSLDNTQGQTSTPASAPTDRNTPPSAAKNTGS
jgi:rhodanese-related sulfurtransferase